ncbi:hypothetical protein pb186bvf_018838 [Paramecium bursaria]
MNSFIWNIIRYEKRLEQLKQDLILDPNFSLNYFPEQITLIELSDLFKINTELFFYKYDANRDGIITQQEMIQITMPKQKEYQQFRSEIGSIQRLQELIELTNEYENNHSRQDKNITIYLQYILKMYREGHLVLELEI